MAIEIKRILLPTDFSTYSATATKYACELSVTNAACPKDPPQPMVRCDGYQPRDEGTSRWQEESPGSGLASD
jgi:hypothetical protein